MRLRRFGFPLGVLFVAASLATGCRKTVADSASDGGPEGAVAAGPLADEAGGVVVDPGPEGGAAGTGGQAAAPGPSGAAGTTAATAASGTTATTTTGATPSATPRGAP